MSENTSGWWGWLKKAGGVVLVVLVFALFGPYRFPLDDEAKGGDDDLHP